LIQVKTNSLDVAIGHFQTSQSAYATSALPLKADISRTSRDVRFCHKRTRAPLHAVVGRRDIAEVAGVDSGQRNPARPLQVNDAAHLLIVRLVLRFAVVDRG
jgi:hypothetical protein